MFFYHNKKPKQNKNQHNIFERAWVWVLQIQVWNVVSSATYWVAVGKLPIESAFPHLYKWGHK